MLSPSNAKCFLLSTILGRSTAESIARLGQASRELNPAGYLTLIASAIRAQLVSEVSAKETKHRFTGQPWCFFLCGARCNFPTQIWDQAGVPEPAHNHGDAHSSLQLSCSELVHLGKASARESRILQQESRCKTTLEFFKHLTKTQPESQLNVGGPCQP